MQGSIHPASKTPIFIRLILGGHNVLPSSKCVRWIRSLFQWQSHHLREYRVCRRTSGPIPIPEEIARLSIPAVCTNIALYRRRKSIHDQFQFRSKSFGLRRFAITLVGEEVMVAAQVNMLVCQVPFGY